MIGIIIINVIVIIALGALLFKKLGKNSVFKYVENKSKKFNEDQGYFKLEHEGSCYLFTDTELNRANERAQREKCGE